MKAYFLDTLQEKRDIDRILENDRLPFIDMRIKPGKISAAFLHHLVAKKNGVQLDALPVQMFILLTSFLKPHSKRS